MRQTAQRGPQEPPADLISASEAAAILDTSRSTIVRWAASGSLPVVGKLGTSQGAYVFSRTAIERLRDERAPLP